MLVALVMSLLLAESPAPAQERDASEERLVEELASENLDGSIGLADPLEFSQNERQQAFGTGLSLNLGPVVPWSNFGVGIFWSSHKVIQNVNLGAGSFEFSDNYRERNYLVEVDSQSAYYAARFFVLGFGPIYVEPFAGLVRWSGSIKPRGFDNLQDELASSLNSRFDISGLSVGGNFGLMWIFSNGVFLDYNLVGLNASTFIQKTFTTNTREARTNVRKELAGPLTMSNLQLRVGYAF